jgi:hypothetical protein
MTSTRNFFLLQGDLKDYIKGEYDFRSTRNWTRNITKEIDYSIIKSYLENNYLQYFAFSPNSEMPTYIKAVVSCLSPSTTAEVTSNSLDDLGFNVICVRQLINNRRPPHGQTHVETLLLFLVTLIIKAKSQEIVKLNGLNHISIIKVESYTTEAGLMPCYNCQNFGHVWTNCQQPSRCLWHGVATCI